MSDPIAQILVKCKACHEGPNVVDCPVCVKLAQRVKRAWDLTNKIDEMLKLYFKSTTNVFGDGEIED